jgi:gag-polypeptide of LTR copia-type
MDTTSYKFPKLKGSSNYDLWSIRAQAFIVDRGHYKAVTSLDSSEEEKIKICATLRLLLEDEPLIQTKNINDPATLWQRLKTLYGSTGFSSEFLISKELFSTTLSQSGSIEAYLTQIVRLTNELQARNLAIPNKVIAAYALSNLTPEWENTVAIISQSYRNQKEDIDLAQLFGQLIDEGRRRQARIADTEMAMTS